MLIVWRPKISAAHNARNLLAFPALSSARPTAINVGFIRRHKNGSTRFTRLGFPFTQFGMKRQMSVCIHQNKIFNSVVSFYLVQVMYDHAFRYGVTDSGRHDRNVFKDITAFVRMVMVLVHNKDVSRLVCGSASIPSSSGLAVVQRTMMAVLTLPRTIVALIALYPCRVSAELRFAAVASEGNHA